MDSFILKSFEKYSSTIEQFSVLGSATYPSTEWMDLGNYSVSEDSLSSKDLAGITNFTSAAQETLVMNYMRAGVPGEEFFLLAPEIGKRNYWVRYLKFRFNEFAGSEYYCTLTQLTVHGRTVLESFKEEMISSEEEVRSLHQALSGDLGGDLSGDTGGGSVDALVELMTEVEHDQGQSQGPGEGAPVETAVEGGVTADADADAGAVREASVTDKSTGVVAPSGGTLEATDAGEAGLEEVEGASIVQFETMGSLEGAGAATEEEDGKVVDGPVEGVQGQSQPSDIAGTGTAAAVATSDDASGAELLESGLAVESSVGTVSENASECEEAPSSARVTDETVSATVSETPNGESNLSLKNGEAGTETGANQVDISLESGAAVEINGSSVPLGEGGVSTSELPTASDPVSQGTTDTDMNAHTAVSDACDVVEASSGTRSERKESLMKDEASSLSETAYNITTAVEISNSSASEASTNESNALAPVGAGENEHTGETTAVSVESASVSENNGSASGGDTGSISASASVSASVLDPATGEDKGAIDAAGRDEANIVSNTDNTTADNSTGNIVNATSSSGNLTSLGGFLSSVKDSLFNALGGVDNSNSSNTSIGKSKTDVVGELSVVDATAGDNVTNSTSFVADTTMAAKEGSREGNGTVATTEPAPAAVSGDGSLIDVDISSDTTLATGGNGNESLSIIAPDFVAVANSTVDNNSTNATQNSLKASDLVARDPAADSILPSRPFLAGLEGAGNGTNSSANSSISAADNTTTPTVDVSAATPTNHSAANANAATATEHNASSVTVPLSTPSPAAVPAAVVTATAAAASSAPTVSSSVPAQFHPASCADILKFSVFQAKMMAKLSKPDEPVTSFGSGSSASAPYENVFRTLMQRIKSLEVKYAIIEVFSSQIGECYSYLHNDTNTLLTQALAGVSVVNSQHSAEMGQLMLEMTNLAENVTNTALGGTISDAESRREQQQRGLKNTALIGPLLRHIQGLYMLLFDINAEGSDSYLPILAVVAVFSAFGSAVCLGCCIFVLYQIKIKRA